MERWRSSETHWLKAVKSVRGYFQHGGTEAGRKKGNAREQTNSSRGFHALPCACVPLGLILCTFVLAALVLSPVGGVAQELKPVRLPKPQMDIGRPLMQVLKDRSSARAFSPEKLPEQVLSNLLWAAFGVNRPDSGKRTAPSAVNWQETDIYVATADGLYVYDAREQQLNPVLRDDVRAQTGTQPFVKDAPVDLVYVSDLAKTGAASADRDMYVAADVGFIAENVYLFCASEGLAVVVRGSIDRPALAKAMRLRPDQRITLSQTVGYPKK